MTYSPPASIDIHLQPGTLVFQVVFQDKSSYSLEYQIHLTRLVYVCEGDASQRQGNQGRQTRR